MSRPLWQRVAVPVVAILVVVVVAAAVIGVGVVRRAYPQTTGELSVPGLRGEVEIIRDERGIPHIYADTPEDLFRAQGYVAAQDRFFQMDLRRHIVSGRLSELVGEGGLETDKVIRTMGWRRVAEQELPMLSPTSRTYLQAYSAGVNAYLERQGGSSALGLEYVVLAQSAPGYQVEPWSEIDSLAWLKAMAWDLRGNYEDELARGLLVGQIPLNQLNSLYPDYPIDRHPPILGRDDWTPPAPQRGESQARGGTRGPVVVPEPGATPDPADTPPMGQEGPGSTPTDDATHNWLAGGGVPAPVGEAPEQGSADAALLQASAAMAAVPELVGRGEGIGSNSWVVSGEHTTSGMPLLANDPHLAVTQPGVFTQVGLHCRVVSSSCPFDVAGFTFAGFPGVIIGHNADIAWGLTNLDPDVTDFYLEDVMDDRVRRGNEYVPMDVRTETIKVAGGEDVELTVRETVHGPLISDAMADVADLGQGAPLGGVQTSNDYAVSLAWTALHPGRTADAIFAMNQAANFEDFRDAARLFTVPAQNLIYADVEGNIGYQAPGQIPIRTSATHGTPPGYYPAPGWDRAYDWTGWVDFEDLPWTYNPPSGKIVAANQAVVRGTRPFLTTEYDKGYRSTRILELLENHLEEGPLSVEDMQQIQLDDRSAFAEVLTPYLLAAQLDGDFYTEAQDLLREWDFTSPAEGENSAAAAYFYAVYSHLLESVLDDELPPELGASGNSRSMLLVEELLASPDSPWWDDRRTPGVTESRDEVIRAAMINARLDLTKRISKDPSRWTWGELHQVAMEHQVLSGEDVPTLVERVFGQPARPVSGSSAMVNAMNWDASLGSFNVTSGPAMRMVVDLSDLDASTWVNQTGASGHPYHPHYTDQTQSWIDGETYPWPFTREAVVEAERHTLTLTPESGPGR
ncbi:penicillin acylase family protein [Ornithinimicrobium sp. Y1694]|uniref:penicillin acylase family protein n=1 Tax=Ornithinimicrobium sp. Y1694 TaxID=3418590 RepID=UPI003CE6D440